MIPYCGDYGPASDREGEMDGTCPICGALVCRQPESCRDEQIASPSLEEAA